LAGDDTVKKRGWQSASNTWKVLKPAAKKLRQEPTEAEKTLWNALRRKALCNLKFRRQHAIGQYIVDFYCTQKKLIIELDGPIHQFTKEEDSFRQRYLESLGFLFLRFKNDEVLNDLENVLLTISKTISDHNEPPLSEIGEG
jgi:very-short-patch-repair endonuclease